MKGTRFMITDDVGVQEFAKAIADGGLSISNARDAETGENLLIVHKRGERLPPSNVVRIESARAHRPPA